MNKELEEKLFEEYKEFFVDKDDMRKSGMWCGFSHGDGWFFLVEMILKRAKNQLDWDRDLIARMNEDPEKYEKAWKDKPLYKDRISPFDPSIFQVFQVKEKFGTLRFYFSGGDLLFQGFVDAIEQMSAYICEICGQRGEARNISWVRTLCDEHYQEKLNA